MTATIGLAITGALLALPYAAPPRKATPGPHLTRVREIGDAALGRLTSFATGSNPNVLFCASERGRVAGYDVTTGKQTFSKIAGAPSIGVSYDHRTLYFGYPQRGEISSCDVASGNRASFCNYSDNFLVIPKSTLIARKRPGKDGAWLGVYDYHTERYIGWTPIKDALGGGLVVTSSRKGMLGVIARPGDIYDPPKHFQAVLWAAPYSAAPHRITVEGKIVALAITPDDRHVAILTNEGALSVYGVVPEKRLALHALGRAGRQAALSASPSGRHFVIATPDGLLVWDIAGGKVVLEQKCDLGSEPRIAILGEMHLATTAKDAGKILIWRFDERTTP